jgi:CheY-like chemotaxis protein
MASPQNVFDEASPTATNSDVGAAAIDSKSRMSPNEKSAVVKTLRANPPKSAKDLARAIQLTSRIRRWDEVNYWMDQINKAGVNEDSATQMVQSVGSETFLSLQIGNEEISDEHKSLAKKILELSRLRSLDPARLRAHARSLLSNDKQSRIQAFRSLQAAGSQGVKALIDLTLSEESIIPNSTMSEALSLMGKTAIAAWLEAMTTSDAKARGRLALLAAPVGDPSMALELCSVANDEMTPEHVRKELESIAQNRNKKIPNADATFRYAVNQMNQGLKDFQRVRWHDEADAFTTWELASSGLEVIERSARESDIQWKRVLQLTNSVLKLGPISGIDSALAVAINLEGSARLGTEVNQASINARFPSLMRESYEFGCLVWDAAEQADLSTAQLQAVANLARWAAPGTMPLAVRDRLSQACKSGYASVRYEAAGALVKSMMSIKPDGSTDWVDQSFEGRNRLERILAEMRLLEDRPLTLVVGGNPGLRGHAHELMEAFGSRVLEASSANQVFSSIREGQPIEAILIVDRVLEMDLGQLIQRIRGNPTTGRCPIALLAESLSNREHAVADTDPRVVMGSLPPEHANFVDILRRMRIVSQSPSIDPSSRIAWKELAKAYWLDVESALVAKQPKDGFSPVVQSPVGQRHLISIVLDKSQPMPKREQASQIFVQSVKDFGLLISTETANAQYDEYNSRGPTEVDLRGVLGRVLDAIEASRGDKPWSEVAP